MVRFFRGSINNTNRMIECYENVLDDINIEFYDPVLEETKGPVIEFLEKVRELHEKHREALQKNLNELI